MMWELDERMNDVVLGFWVDRKRSLKIRTVDDDRIYRTPNNEKSVLYY